MALRAQHPSTRRRSVLLVAGIVTVVAALTLAIVAITVLRRGRTAQPARIWR